MTKPRTSPGTPPGVAVGGGGARRVISRTTYAQHQPPLLSSQRTPIQDPDTSNERVVLLPVDGGRGIETDAVLKWCVDNLYRDGDTFLLLHVAPTKGLEAPRQGSGARLRTFRGESLDIFIFTLNAPRYEGRFPSHRPRNPLLPSAVKLSQSPLSNSL